jgi:hypothetical protein
MPRNQQTLSEIISDYGESLKASIYHTLPGVVKAYYSDGTADVMPAVHDVRFDVDTGERISEPSPIIPHVRIMYPSGGGFSITWPLAPGDKVTLHAYDLDPTVHQLTGAEADPQDIRRHGGTYWQCVPGDCTDGAPTATAGQVTITGPMIVLGAGAADFAALASKVDACMAAIKTHTHPVTVAGPLAGTAAASVELAVPGTLPPSGSSVVKVKA